MNKNNVHSNEEIKTTGGLDKDFKNARRFDFREINPSDIQICSSAPGYIDDTDAEYVSCLNTPEGNFLIDGHNLFYEAKQSGAKSIRCFVEIVDKHEDILIELNNLKTRTKPHGGTARSPEILLRLRRCKIDLDQAGANVVRFSHGGNRKGEAFTNDQAHNVRVVLQKFSGLKKSATNEALAYAEGINDETLMKLAHGIQRPKKGKPETDLKVVWATNSFWGKIQKIKMKALMKLQEDGITPEECEKTISAKVWAAFNEDPTGTNISAFDDIIGTESKPAASKKAVKSAIEETVQKMTDESLAAEKPVVENSAQSIGRQDQPAGSQEMTSSEQDTNLHPFDSQGEGLNKQVSSEPAHVSTIREMGQYLIELAKSDINEKEMAFRVEAVIVSLTEVAARLREIPAVQLAA